MFQRRIFEYNFGDVLREEMERKGMSIKELSRKTGISCITLYKLLSGERDPRLLTVKKIAEVLSPMPSKFIAVIGAKFLLDDISGTKLKMGKDTVRVRGFTANSVEECIVAAARAYNEGALGIICAPVLSSIIEKIVDIPVVIMKPSADAVTEALEQIKSQFS